ncbi:MAG: KTSC domain-containing protein [Eubacteriales bacterium]
MGVEMHRVVSSNVLAVGYNEELQIVHVQFQNGSEYMYKGVPKHEYEGLINAPSIGSYLFQNFKNVYPYERIS